MKRAHLFEFGDQPWFPRVFRDLLTDSLQFGITKLGYYDAAAPLIGRLLAHMKTTEVVDMCSGGTGPWLRLRELLAREGHPGVSVTFTDKYASEAARRRVAEAGDPRLEYLDRSVDATAVPADLAGVRTIFTGFHHFAEGDARRILEDAARNGRAIGIFEFTERTLPSFVVAALVPPMMFAITPFIRPVTFERLFWTYVLPVVPLCNLWDGVVSNLRTYSPDELTALAGAIAVDGETYTWEAGRIPGSGPRPPLTYLIGAPRLPPSQ